MNMIIIQESGMSFGPFPEELVFRIEKSPTLLKLNKVAQSNEGISIAEFLLFKSTNNKNYVSIIEAKTSSPHPTNRDDFESYISQINEKLVNSLHLFISFYLNRHDTGYSELPIQFKSIPLENIAFELILVVKNSEDSWLRPVYDDLRAALKPIVKLWNISPTAIKVFNEDMAREKQLVS